MDIENEDVLETVVDGVKDIALNLLGGDDTDVDGEEEFDGEEYFEGELDEIDLEPTDFDEEDFEGEFEGEFEEEFDGELDEVDLEPTDFEIDETKPSVENEDGEDENCATDFSFLDSTSNTLFDSTGNPIEKQIKEGTYTVVDLDLELLDIPPRTKIFDIEVSSLEESIHQWGVIEPLHVIPYETRTGEERYILVHGYRRYLACFSLGMTSVPTIIDTTRPKEIVRYLEVIVNNVKSYNFVELMRMGEYIEQRQKGFSHEIIENILGLPSGAYLKSKYIEAAKDDFPEIYEKVGKGTMTVDAAFKKIEKELNAGNAGGSALDNLNQNGLDTGYDNVDDKPNVQKKGERHPLDPALRKEVERRDNYTCQSCGTGRENVSYSAIFHAHHMIPVKHHGPDSDRNLVMLCPNCHGYVHGIDEGRFKPKKSMVEENPEMKNIVILANIVKKGLPQGCVEEPYDFFIAKASQPWLSDELLQQRTAYEELRKKQLENENEEIVPNEGFADDSDDEDLDLDSDAVDLVADVDTDIDETDE